MSFRNPINSTIIGKKSPTTPAVHGALMGPQSAFWNPNSLNPKPSRLLLYSGKYKVWFFSARGGVGQWTGTWSDADNKMTWDGTDSPSGAKLTGYTKITGNHQEWNLQVDNHGKVTTDSGSLERKK
jgi:hypothetical protein